MKSLEQSISMLIRSNRYSVLIAVLSVSILLSACGNGNKKSKQNQMTVEETIFGQHEGQEVKTFLLKNSTGMEVELTNYGAIVMAMRTPDKNGKIENIVLGFDTPKDYWTEPYMSNVCYLGAIVGRYGNRIAEGKFSLNGQTYDLAVNNGPNHLHGGIKGFDKVVWNAKTFQDDEGVGVSFSYLSVDGEEGYPGNFTIKVIYTLNDNNELKIDYYGEIDQACPVNVTHHGYFNLTGGAKRDILGHEIQINAERYTVVDETLIPTGELRLVEGTPMDFRTPHPIGERIDQVDGGYDHNYVLSNDVEALRKVIEVREPGSGRIMEVLTTEPGVQFYSGNFLDGALTGRGGVVYNQHWGFCLETQHYPDSPNQPAFPTTILEPGEQYRHTTIYKFRTE